MDLLHKTNKFGCYDFQNKRLCNIGAPCKPTDALRKCDLIDSNLNVSACNRRIVDVGEPIQENDAINLKFLHKRRFLGLSPGGVYDCKQKKITNIAGPPTSETDAVSLGYLKNHSLLGEGDAFNANNKRITNLALPLTKTDAVSIEYIHSEVRNRKRQKREAELAEHDVTLLELFDELKRIIELLDNIEQRIHENNSKLSLYQTETNKKLTECTSKLSLFQTETYKKLEENNSKLTLYKTEIDEKIEERKVKIDKLINKMKSNKSMIINQLRYLTEKVENPVRGPKVDEKYKSVIAELDKAIE